MPRSNEHFDARELLQMMTFGDQETINAKIDENSSKLINEFYEHLRKVRISDPAADQRMVYEGWMIQKVSGLQVLLMAMNERMNLVAESTERR